MTPVKTKKLPNNSKTMVTPIDFGCDQVFLRNPNIYIDKYVYICYNLIVWSDYSQRRNLVYQRGFGLQRIK